MITILSIYHIFSNVTVTFHFESSKLASKLDVHSLLPTKDVIHRQTIKERKNTACVINDHHDGISNGCSLGDISKASIFHLASVDHKCMHFAQAMT